jgi:hypothetical protein
MSTLPILPVRTAKVDNSTPIDSEHALEFEQVTSDAIGPVREGPPWKRDSVVLSDRFRVMLRAVKPALLRTVSYWDQKVRSLRIGGRTVTIAESGCYRVD